MDSRPKSAGTLVLVAALCCSALPALAQQKIAVIDVARIMTESKRGRDVLAQLEKLQADKTAELQALTEEIAELQKRFQEGRLSLTEEKLAELQSELESKGRNFERAREDAERLVQRTRAEDIKKVEDEVLPIINLVGKELGYTLIFQKYQSGLVYAAEELDITELILQRFNASVAN